MSPVQLDGLATTPRLNRADRLRLLSSTKLRSDALTHHKLNAFGLDRHQDRRVQHGPLISGLALNLYGHEWDRYSLEQLPTAV